MCEISSIGCPSLDVVREPSKENFPRSRPLSSTNMFSLLPSTSWLNNPDTTSTPVSLAELKVIVSWPHCTSIGILHFTNLDEFSGKKPFSPSKLPKKHATKLLNGKIPLLEDFRNEASLIANPTRAQDSWTRAQASQNTPCPLAQKFQTWMLFLF